MSKLAKTDKEEVKRANNYLAYLSQLLPKTGDNQLIPYLKNGKYGFCTPDKEILVECIFEQAEPFSDGYALVRRSSGGYMFIDDKGKVLYPPENIHIQFAKSFQEGLAFIQTTEKKGFINTEGQIVTHGFDYVEGFKNGLAIVDKSESVFSRNYLLVHSNGPRVGVINKVGVEIIPCDFLACHRCENGSFKVTAIGYVDYNIIYDSAGNELPPPKNIIEFDPDFKEGLFPTRYIEGGNGYTDKENNILVDAVYDNTYPFNEGFGRVFRNGRYGFINRRGEEVIPLKYRSASEFNNGLAFVNWLNGKGFYIDKMGNEYRDV